MSRGSLSDAVRAAGYAMAMSDELLGQPEPKPVPNVIGMSVTDASNALKDWGFPVSRVDGSPLKKVLITEPSVGSMQLPGTPVRLVTQS